MGNSQSTAQDTSSIENQGIRGSSYVMKDSEGRTKGFQAQFTDPLGNHSLRLGVDTQNKTLTNVGACSKVGQATTICVDKIGPTLQVSGSVELARWDTPSSATSLTTSGLFNFGSPENNIPPHGEGRLGLNINIKK